MTRAEQAALYAYPKKSAVSGVSMLGNNNRDDFMFQRDIFRKGYEQAEKDLALTADDVGRIHNLVRKMQFRYNATVGCYPEVAEIFNNERK